MLDNNVKTWGIALAVVALFLLFLFRVNSQREPIQDFDRAGQPIIITVHTYKTKEEVNEAFKKWLGSEISKIEHPQAIREGWSTWSEGKCEIHVVDVKYQTEADVLQTWGHELAHCMKGNYHKR